MTDFPVATKKKIKHDVILALICLAVALVAWLVLHFTAKTGDTVVITFDGAVYKELPLNEDVNFVFQQEGVGTNVIEIKDGYVNVIGADCPDKICVNSHKISKSGETITCLPHRLVVSVDGDGGPDIVE